MNAYAGITRAESKKENVSNIVQPVEKPLRYAPRHSVVRHAGSKNKNSL